MRVVEIFESIDGEGVRTGLPVVFIRLYGCNLNCSYCDTPYSHTTEADKVVEMSYGQIVDKVLEYGIKNVTITGGEPLIHEGIENLLDILLECGCIINVETNGTQPVPERFKEERNVFFTMDYKGYSSGMRGEMSLSNLQTLRPHDVLKFVVGTKGDLDDMRSVIRHLPSTPIIYVSPVFGQIEPSAIVDYILVHKLHNVRVQVQLHKIIWAPDKRGV